MFTGLVEEKGRLVAVESDYVDTRNLTIQCSVIREDANIGDSIAINGCCLTIVAIIDNGLVFQAGKETLSRTNLGQLKTQDSLNLERAIRTGDRLGGHYVSGHVDGLGQVAKRVDEADWSYFWINLPENLTRQMATKGSVTVDGVSLTIVDVYPQQFSVALIPHTLSATTLGERVVGDSVNVETDILAKYVEQQLKRGTLQSLSDE